MKLEEIISEFQNKYRLTNLAPDSQGVYRLGVNGQYTIYLANAVESDHFFLYADICSFYPDRDSRLWTYERLLTANLFGKETNHSYFAIDLDRSMILLIHRFDPSIPDFMSFIEEFRDFIKLLNLWEKKIEEGALISSEKDTSQPPSQISMNIQRKV